ncbi:hypothetical protein D3C83_187360 [compost metagenome]
MHDSGITSEAAGGFRRNVSAVFQFRFRARPIIAQRFHVGVYIHHETIASRTFRCARQPALGNSDKGIGPTQSVWRRLFFEW